MSTETLYVGLILLICGERLLELLITRRNTERLIGRGGYEVGQGHFPWMALLHAGLLVAAPLEVFLLDRPFVPILGGSMFFLLCLTMALRYWAISSLGDRWTVKVLVVPGEAPVAGGPYRFLRHPNYLAVILEVVALPLIHTAWWTALFGSLCNLWVLRARIRVEERALAETSDYFGVLGDRPGLPLGGGR